MSGMVTIVWLDRKNYSVVGVKNIDPIKPPCFGFPGGVIENKENPQDAASREGKEETGLEESFRNETPIIRERNGRHGEKYFQYIFLKSDHGETLRPTGVPNEVEPAKRIPLIDITNGRIKFFRTHLEVLGLLLEKLSEEDVIFDDRLEELKKFLGTPRK